MAVFTCPQCGHSQTVDDKHVGKNATCPKCKTQGVVRTALPPSDITPVKLSLNEPTTRHTRQAKIYVPYKFDESSLQMEWIVIDDPRLPIQFVEACGVIPSIDSEHMLGMGGGGDFCYQADIAAEVADVFVTAFEMRFLLFGVWGYHARTLSAVEVKDLEQGRHHEDKYKWTLFSEAEGREHYASIGYIARVRTNEGKVLLADTEFILREAQRFSEKFTEDDLEPKSPKKE